MKSIIVLLAIVAIATLVAGDYSTSQLRTLWAPACNTGNLVTVTLPSPTGAKVTIDSRVAPFFRKMHNIMYAWNWDPPASSTGAYNCRQITGGTDYSLHAYGIAGDYDWNKNPYGSTLITNMPQGMVDEILAIRTTGGHNVFRWGGYYTGNKDAMHYEIIASPAQIATGISAGQCTTSSGTVGQCVHSSRCSTTGVSGLCPGASSITCCTGQVNTKRTGSGSTTGSTGSSSGSTYGSCTANGVTGVCKDVSTCTGLTTSGLCPGSSSIQCCTLPKCTGHTGTCMKVSSCQSGYTFSGYCPGDSTIKCCTNPIQTGSSTVEEAFVIDEPFNSTTYTYTMMGDDDDAHLEAGNESSASTIGISPAAIVIAAIACIFARFMA